MRYYHPFQGAIPHRRVDYPRVTHPCATLLTPEGAFSFDLHVLSAPLTFVLSQDQTLQFELVNTLGSKLPAGSLRRPVFCEHLLLSCQRPIPLGG